MEQSFSGPGLFPHAQKLWRSESLHLSPVSSYLPQLPVCPLSQGSEMIMYTKLSRTWHARWRNGYREGTGTNTAQNLFLLYAAQAAHRSV